MALTNIMAVNDYLYDWRENEFFWIHITNLDRLLHGDMTDPLWWF